MRHPDVATAQADRGPGLSEILASDPGDEASLTGGLDGILHREQRFPPQVLTLQH